MSGREVSHARGASFRSPPGLRKEPKRSPTASPLWCEVDPQPREETLTALGGIPLGGPAFGSWRRPESVRQPVRVQARARGDEEAPLGESLVLLHAAGGESRDAWERLRPAPGWAERRGQAGPWPRAAREFWEAFPEEEKSAEARPRGGPDPSAYLPEETRPREGRGRGHRAWLPRFGERRPDPRLARVDQDAPLIASRQREAQPPSAGGRGSQPRRAVGAETGRGRAEQLRDGHGPAQMEPLAVAQRAFATLSRIGGMKEYYYRGASAWQERSFGSGRRDEPRAGGPPGRSG
jgi:hypothetical protein